MNKIAIAGILAAVLMFSALGAVIMTGGSAGGTMSQDEINEYTLTDNAADDTNAQYLLTPEQIENMRNTAQEMRDNHSTRTEIRETLQAMTHDYVQGNLESYGLAPEEIEQIQAKMTELMDKMLEIRETAFDLWEQDMNRRDIRQNIQPLIDEAQMLRGELRDMLDQYGILPPDIGHPGMGHGHGGRPGRFGGLGGHRP